MPVTPSVQVLNEKLVVSCPEIDANGTALLRAAYDALLTVGTVTSSEPGRSSRLRRSIPSSRARLGTAVWLTCGHWTSIAG